MLYSMPMLQISRTFHAMDMDICSPWVLRTHLPQRLRNYMSQLLVERFFVLEMVLVFCLTGKNWQQRKYRKKGRFFSLPFIYYKSYCPNVTSTLYQGFHSLFHITLNPRPEPSILFGHWSWKICVPAFQTKSSEPCGLKLFNGAVPLPDHEYTPALTILFRSFWFVMIVAAPSNSRWAHLVLQ